MKNFIVYINVDIKYINYQPQMCFVVIFGQTMPAGVFNGNGAYVKICSYHGI